MLPLAAAIPIIGAGIGAAGSLIGGAISNRANKKAAQREYEHQKEFAQHGIRWKVADAKAAGLHPLYALGGQPTQYSPSIIPDSMGPALADAGQNISRAMAAQQTTPEREAHQLALANLRAQISESDARRGLIEAEAFKLRQETMHSAPMPMGVMRAPDLSMYGLEGQESVLPESQVLRARNQGKVKVVTPQVGATSIGDTSKIAGDPAAWRAFQAAPDLKIFLPAGNEDKPAEVLESLADSPLLMYMVYQENIKRQGPEWGRRFQERYFGRDAKRGYIGSWLESLRQKGRRNVDDMRKKYPNWKGGY